MTRLPNPVPLEAFHWHTPADHKHWRRLQCALPSLSAIGITDLWLPPGSKGEDAESKGYNIYDAWDLGEFDQKGTLATKWGTKEDLVHLAAHGKNHGIGLMWDAILNHRAFADATELVKVMEVNPRDRREDITEPFDIVAWSKFNFEGRNGKYSSFKFNKHHFNGTDWDQRTEKRSIYRCVEDGKNWAQDVGKLQGNTDYLMFENIDYTNREVVEDTTRWGEWIVEELGLSGFRLDAVQHYSWNFADRWTQHLKKMSPNGLLCVGEFWSGNVNELFEWMANMSPDFKLYDVPHSYRDLRAVFQDTLVERKPDAAVTFLRNYDTQKGQDMETPISYAFTPHAYSLLLLREGGHPCVFFGDLYGITTGPYPEGPTCYGKLPDLILARKLYAYGAQAEFFNRSDCIGWTRAGTEARPDGMAVVLSWSQSEEYESSGPSISMNVGFEHAGEVWTDVLGFEWSAIVIDEEGWGKFPYQRNGMACFVNKAAEGRERFPVQFNADFQGLLV
ncbi:alpha amylase [Byssothecium circinans]|uniref:Alpha amylase n=1 Tax=Byssothecium circinans TaxID=147558 RepID=A0A6A5U705_9PLEO|nr:alpha amylase [Byssothecium circinans]